MACLFRLAATLWLSCLYQHRPKEIRDPETGVRPWRRYWTIPSAIDGATVRWGGEIIAVENQAQITWVEILGAP
jgi:starvation-inducible outer membrane lipoprotein